MNTLLTPFLSRCEAILQIKMPDGRYPNAAGMRDEIISDLGILFLEDGSGNDSDKLDFYECRFNSAFRTFRIDYIRRELKRINRLMPLPPTDDGDDSPDEEVLARLSKAFQVPSTHFSELCLNDLLTAIDALPSDERKAVVLCCRIGYKIESEDPSERTAATICNVSGRMIRYRLQRARAKLSQFNEDV